MINKKGIKWLKSFIPWMTSCIGYGVKKMRKMAKPGLRFVVEMCIMKNKNNINNTKSTKWIQ